MTVRVWALLAVILACGAQTAGCGKPTIPGRQFQGERVTLPGVVATDTPLPAKPVQEWGPKDAKVQVTAFFPMDEPHRKILDLIEEVAKKHPGRVHARYIDFRTPEGARLFQESKATVACIQINGASSVELPSSYGPRTVDFVRDMGRFWTADDLREAVAVEVKRAYGG